MGFIFLGIKVLDRVEKAHFFFSSLSLLSHVLPDPPDSLLPFAVVRPPQTTALVPNSRPLTQLSSCTGGSRPSVVVREKGRLKARRSYGVPLPEIPPPTAITEAAWLNSKLFSHALIPQKDSLPLSLGKENRVFEFLGFLVFLFD